MPAASAALRLGETEAAIGFGTIRLISDMSGVLVRLDPELHPLLDRPPFAPARSPNALVWPLESPMIDRVRHRFFRETRIESGLPEGSAVR